MTNIGKTESFDDGFLREALGVIAKRDERGRPPYVMAAWRT